MNVLILLPFLFQTDESQVVMHNNSYNGNMVTAYYYHIGNDEK